MGEVLMTRIYDLMSMDALSNEIIDGYVRVQEHPDFPGYRIYNYTEKAQFDNHWTDVTMLCRGLIVSGETVIARPFTKFFNYEQRKAEFDKRLGDTVIVTDKMDGSLGIMYRDPNGEIAFATRGSFTSDQAKHATYVFRQKYQDLDWNDQFTLLVEIIYPENRIVCDYDGMDDLVLLGAVNIRDGHVYSAQSIPWEGPRVEELHAINLAEALALEPREGKEGIVVRFLDDNEMCKIKQEDYITLHKLVTGLSERAVWEGLGQGKTVAQICEPLPDEFHAWVAEVADNLNTAYQKKIFELDDEYIAAFGDMPHQFTRKEFALRVKDSPNRAFMFSLLDQVDIGPKVWQSLKPHGDTRLFGGRTEDNA